MKNSKLVSALILLSGVLFSALASAGSTYFVDVAVDEAARTARGTALTARRAIGAGNSDAIQCNIRGYRTGSSSSVECWARDKDGDYLICYSTAPAIVQAAGSFISFPYITFGAETNGDCSSLTVSVGSRHIPD